MNTISVGISFNKYHQKYEVYRLSQGVKKHIGYYPTEEEAEVIKTAVIKAWGMSA